MAVKTNGFVVPEELMKLLLSLASSWGDLIDTNMLKVVHLNGAMTNEVYRISWPTKTDNDTTTRTVLVRIYGEGAELFFNREEEIRTFECISKHGQGPRLLGLFPEGRVEEFIYAKTLSAGDLRDVEVSALVAAKLREFHNLDMPGPKNVVLWNTMRHWLNEAKSLCSFEIAEEFRLDTLEEEILLLEKELSRDDQEVAFCHNDLQYGNIMMNEETRSITLIDYEYASYNPVAYDLANHFCEMAANYHTETPHVLDYSVYPGNQPSDNEVEQLMDDAEKHTLANHLFWGLWGIISSYVNHIDFDYMEYARQRFQQFWLRKPELLGTTRCSFD
ncbi:probable choline kinase 1 isoform X2 [Rhododendron vialii]|uniref:probable choline kinase 1 isoform X2 n=1 Tax=Rhododendron vialii TaxID=182163 RepID=UPI00265EC2FB|nr:probable choline kinase 1 isoform X2 [Rhododendron vialii]